MGGAYEVTGSTIRKYYSIAGMMVAMRDADGIKFLLTDHLGSMVAITNASGTLISEQRYLPFGQVREDVGTIAATDFGYTGQRALPEMGLMDYRARFYDALLMRFIQPDSIVPIPGNPQTFNRYSYVGNSPINFSDPSGHTSIDEINRLKRAYGKHRWQEGGVSKGWNRNGSLPTAPASSIAGSGRGCRNPLCESGGLSENSETPSVTFPVLTGSGWTDAEISAIHFAWQFLITEFGSQAAVEAALGGSIAFEHVAPGSLGENIVARPNASLDSVLVDSAAFPGTGDKMVWYALHELAHIFDKIESSGDPTLYKSQRFVDKFSPGCVVGSHGCEPPQWNPSDKETTHYGLVGGSMEDFADSFASTILDNVGAPEYMTFRDVSTVRMLIVNNLISAYSQR
jgi:RHS repeat-associated protein